MTAVDLLVASSGGHLKQLTRLRHRISDLDDVVWATPRSDQGVSLLADETEVVWLPYVRPHDVVGITRAAASLARALRGRRVRRVITTGASPALSALPLAARHRVAVHYIESAARVVAPSLTGRVMQKTPGVRCYTQYASWANHRWHFAGSVFDDFTFVPELRPRTGPLSVVVTVGVNESYGFPRLVKALAQVLPDNAKVLWQIHERDAALLGPGSDVRHSLPAHELQAAMVAADVVISHAGCGSALTALEAGHRPVLVARRAHFAEHVDDHQLQISAELQHRGLAVAVEPDALSLSDLLTALEGRVQQGTAAPLTLRQK